MNCSNLIFQSQAIEPSQNVVADSNYAAIDLVVATHDFLVCVIYRQAVEIELKACHLFCLSSSSVWS